MDQKRRYLFHGHAVGFGGRLVRPTDVVLETDGASALGPVGGRSVWSTSERSYGKAFRIKSAKTLAEGLFDDLDKQIAFTHGQIEEGQLTSTTVVQSEVVGLSVGDLTAKPPEPEFKVRRLRVSLRSRPPLASNEPSIALGEDTVIEGVTVDKFKLSIALETVLYQKHDTRSKLLAAADDAKFLKAFGQLFNLVKIVKGKPVPVPGEIANKGGLIHGTIVREIKWDGESFPGSEIDGNVVSIPNLGRIHFGEIVIRAHSRRVTMVRLQLGSPTGGAAVAGDVDANGSWSI